MCHAVHAGWPVSLDGIRASNERRRSEWLAAMQRAEAAGGGLSEFGQFLVRKDLMVGGPPVRVSEYGALTRGPAQHELFVATYSCPDAERSVRVLFVFCSWSVRASSRRPD